ncbi:unnamed protein product [Macrosiphum euphorbiae]|uniref:Uncharacterized protein n=1 Tax=Macrosiphum euphorbiae TaxID=13131 RepID=A0AAV0WS55_9HEMI|nr:unnamed protein product [Macrosiphum euphorbiae]
MNKKFTFEQKQYILKLGPCQPSAQEMPFYKFPKTNNLSFHAKWYTKTLPDGSVGTQPRLEGLMRIACEQDIPIDKENVINTFANNSNQLMNLLI